MNNLADLIINGSLVAVPTETVYGLACNGLDDKAVKKVYEIKGRPQVKPLSLMVHDKSWIDRFCLNVPEQAYYLADRFWPGPLSIVLESKNIVPEIVRAGGRTVSLRCPDSNLTLQLISEANLPLAAPSANPSGMPSPKSAEEVKGYFGDSIPVIDGGVCSLGIESTIIDLSVKPFSILRSGALSKDSIASALVANMYIVGLTGQSGSGKSFALKLLEEKGYTIIDCDKLYHELLLSDREMLSDIESKFPDAFIDGVLNRKILSSIVFSNSGDLDTLNTITHSKVLREVENLLQQYAFDGITEVAIEAVELFSSGISDFCKKTIGIIADKEIRIERIIERDSLSETEAENRICSQKDSSYYSRNCDVTIDNSTSKEDFKMKLYGEVN